MNFKLEKKLKKQGYRIIIGVDEAGRGPLAGPVVAAAVLLRNFEFRILNFESNSNRKISKDKKWDLIKDSKKLSAKQREILFDFIHENFHVGIGLCDQKIIDRINILQATFLAMKKAVNALARKLQLVISNSDKNRKPNYKLRIASRILLIDGNKKIPNLNLAQKAVVKGDEKVFSIAAASIIAKVTRDRLMQKWHKKYPDYGFDRHKGYGTKLHLERLKKFGPSPIHRLSFHPVKKYIFLPKPVFDVRFRK